MHSGWVDVALICEGSRGACCKGYRHDYAPVHIPCIVRAVRRCVEAKRVRGGVVVGYFNRDRVALIYCDWGAWIGVVVTLKLR